MWRALLYAGIVVAGILALFVERVVAPRAHERHQARVVQDMRLFGDAIEACADANEGRYPKTLDDILPYVEGRWMPRDPWKTMYVYVPSIDDRGYVLFTFGRDHWPGGDGEDADFELHPGVSEPHRVSDCPRPSVRGSLAGGPYRAPIALESAPGQRASRRSR